MSLRASLIWLSRVGVSAVAAGCLCGTCSLFTCKSRERMCFIHAMLRSVTCMFNSVCEGGLERQAYLYGVLCSSFYSSLFCLFSPSSFFFVFFLVWVLMKLPAKTKNISSSVVLVFLWSCTKNNLPIRMRIWCPEVQTTSCLGPQAVLHHASAFCLIVMLLGPLVKLCVNILNRWKHINSCQIYTTFGFSLGTHKHANKWRVTRANDELVTCSIYFCQHPQNSKKNGRITKS